MWQHNLYLALRYYRRSTNFGKPPSKPEIDACEKAYELNSSQQGDNVSMESVIQMAKLYAELLFNGPRGGEEHQKITVQAINFAR